MRHLVPYPVVRKFKCEWLERRCGIQRQMSDDARHSLTAMCRGVFTILAGSNYLSESLTYKFWMEKIALHYKTPITTYSINSGSLLSADSKLTRIS